MSLLARTHDAIHRRRVEVLAEHLAPLLPHGAHMLDVGCGDGELSARLGTLRNDTHIQGVDVLVRPRAAIPVQAFDGSRLPFDDASLDAVLMVDVLHHTDDPLVLLRESVRVARSAVLIKDHLRDGFAAHLTLRGMDWVETPGMEYSYHTITGVAGSGPTHLIAWASSSKSGVRPSICIRHRHVGSLIAPSTSSPRSELRGVIVLRLHRRDGRVALQRGESPALP